jgi:hypothetical protein
MQVKAAAVSVPPVRRYRKSSAAAALLGVGERIGRAGGEALAQLRWYLRLRATGWKAAVAMRPQ